MEVGGNLKQRVQFKKVAMRAILFDIMARNTKRLSLEPELAMACRRRASTEGFRVRAIGDLLLAMTKLDKIKCCAASLT